MSGHHSIEVLRAKMSPERRARNEAVAKKLAAKILRENKEWQAAAKRSYSHGYGPDEPEYSKANIQRGGP